MRLAFILTMPGVASWNGRWSGQDDLHCRVENLGTTLKAAVKGRKALDGGPYFYRWPDGWCAKVEVREVDAMEGRKLAKASKGFCGYEWMIESIYRHGRILADHEVEALKEAGR